ncbi:hypothetical protein, partial [Brevibacillus agri]
RAFFPDCFSYAGKNGKERFSPEEGHRSESSKQGEKASFVSAGCEESGNGFAPSGFLMRTALNLFASAGCIV